MVKVSKDKADYRKGDSGRHCAKCTMFRPPDGCITVTGEIKPGDLCDYYKAKR